MKDIGTLEILKIIEEERKMEMQCAMWTDILRKNTRNPIKRIRYKAESQRYLDHVFGIDLVLSKLKRRVF